MADANEELLDRSLRHQIAVRRFQTHEAREVLEILEQADRELTTKLRERLAKLPTGTTDFTTRRVQDMLADIREARTEVMRQIHGKTRSDLVDFSKSEAAFEVKALQGTIPIDISLAAVPLDRLRHLVTAEQFEGRTLGQWFSSLATADKQRLDAAIQQGIAQGLSIQDIVARVAGTRAANFTDGALATTRRQAETVVRTAVNHVSNSAREEVWDENQDIILALRWTSTLDGRTSAICRARDGKLAPVGDKPLPEGGEPLKPEGARPPAHPNCRSVMVAVLDPEGIVGERPFVTDTRTRAEREVDFRRIAREEGKPIAQVRSEWADANIGQVPAKTTYEEWLKRQPATFQDEVLGEAKGKLFREGDVHLDQFVDETGKELTLEELQASGEAVEITAPDLTRGEDAFPVSDAATDRLNAWREKATANTFVNLEMKSKDSTRDVYRAFMGSWRDDSTSHHGIVSKIIDGTATDAEIETELSKLREETDRIGLENLTPTEFRNFVNEHYAVTQAALEAVDVDDYVTVYRGVTAPQSGEIAQAILRGDETIDFKTHGISSFSSNKEVAESFGSVVVEMKVHRSRIFATYFVDGDFAQGEQEWTVLFGDRPTRVSRNSLTTAQKKTWEQLAGK